MIPKFVLPLLAAVGLGFAIYTVVQAKQGPPPSRPLTPPPSAPRFKAIAGAGLIEARMENIPIGAPVAGVVTKVFVPIFELPVKVQAGDPLFQLDDRPAQAELKYRQALLAAAQAELERLEQAPRPEERQSAEAAYEEAQARLGEAETNFERVARLRQQNSVTPSEYDQARFNRAAARAAAEKARADRDKARNGTWEQDLAVARARVAEAQAQVEAAQTELDRLTVRALVDGEVLQVNVRPGQFAAMAWNQPLVVLGDLRKLHVRVDIDEQDLPHFQPGAPAVATLKGRPLVRFPLQFVKVEPYVIPKRSLTGDNSERVDTRVLQVIYALPDERPVPLYVGLQMDVYIEKAAPPEGVDLDADPAAPKPFEDEPEPQRSDPPAPAKPDRLTRAPSSPRVRS